MADRVICPWCQGAAMVEPGDPLPTAQPSWTRERPTVDGLYWVAKPKDQGGWYWPPEIEDVDGDDTYGVGTDEPAKLLDRWYDGCLWAGPIQPPPLPEPEP